MLKELIKGQTHQKDEKKLSPVEQAMNEFKEQNGYDFLEMTNDPRIRRKHELKQMQKKTYDDDDFLNVFEEKQGE